MRRNYAMYCSHSRHTQSRNSVSLADVPSPCKDRVHSESVSRTTNRENVCISACLVIVDSLELYR